MSPTCHGIVDQQVATYTVERLRGLRSATSGSLAKVYESRERRLGTICQRRFAQHLLRCRPDAALCLYRAVLCTRAGSPPEKIRAPADATVLLPFIVRAEKLISFWPLTEPHSPFTDVISEPGAAERHRSADWWADPDLSGWYVTLLNRSLNKLTGRH